MIPNIGQARREESKTRALEMSKVILGSSISPDPVSENLLYSILLILF